MVTRSLALIVRLLFGGERIRWNEVRRKGGRSKRLPLEYQALGGGDVFQQHRRQIQRGRNRL